MADPQFQNSVMVALLPTTSDWCKIELPHMTLAYVGEIPNLTAGAHNELAKISLMLALTCHKQRLTVLGADIFGTENLVDVLLLRPTPELLAMQSILEPWDVSEHPFNPHATVGPMGSITDMIPNDLVFDRIAVSWGNELLEYKLLE